MAFDGLCPVNKENAKGDNLTHWRHALFPLSTVLFPGNGRFSPK
jgi:hypothetical protein